MITSLTFSNLKLGNAMFVYSALKAICTKNNYQLKLPNIQIFNDFNLKIEELKEADKHQLKYQIITEEFPYNEQFFNIPDNTNMFNYFQSEKYFLNIRDELLNDFSLKEELNKPVEELYNQLKGDSNRTLISIHIRRTDYLDPRYSSFHPVCSMEYYKEALKQFDEIENKFFVICSDDIEWCKENFSFLQPNVYYSVGLKNSQDMILMSKCEHNILANSSFSLFSTFLNKNNNKIVIAPKKWFGIYDINHNTKDLYPKGCIII